MMRNWTWVLVLVVGMGWSAVGAQADLSAGDATVTTEIDVFGAEQQVAFGIVTNDSASEGFADIQVLAEIFDADDEIIGEGLGFLTDQCGKGAAFDYVLPPEGEALFRMKVELYEQDAVIDRIEYTASGTVVEEINLAESDPIPGITPVTTREVAGLEWRTLDDEGNPTDPRVLYGVGCYDDVFTTYDWYAYDPATDTTEAIDHPRAEDAADPTFVDRMDMQSQFTDDVEDFLYNRSKLAYEPNGGTRAVFQTDINTLISTGLDGEFRRTIDDNLFRSTLQGINWVNNGRFIAYYYGGYGDGVTYLVASVDAAYFSTREHLSTPSVTVPTVTPNIGGVIVSGTFNGDEVPGFYIKPPASELYTKWFDWPNLPGNNYPAPVYRSRGGVQSEDVVYFALPEADG
ncbi:MAG: hypothetical protein AAF125_12115, partial [Chloroflexota bacterium]